MSTISRNELVFRYETLEDSLRDTLSNEQLRALIDIYVLALDNYERDIMDAISLYINEYGNDDTKKYMMELIEKKNDAYLKQELNYLINLI
ncbi:hypothetical protein [Escherichia fergusonii]|uniref:Uncharacterized protein n=1 Tax=Escherichia fergusonii (strain ATCC 35469 / DSM 13698 / CCUG 18766 / IAM 14443 / JCM 21226 / LMG 7866 / NBRC 102419 / NCTC 12128 / CDC 0568-73) TaxID=585054 RepID=B7LTT1_ESCF3|nr:hypothetical protein [Escherichia fergusonii]EFL4511629.1 hypothetical protein [Escherichia fergusonii]EFL4515275.1 hypothetical protein [Escherichia fergusonii]EFN0218926.1 hypothetical protein [Escherichia fergusonii]EFO7694950.1 hypothetical protein [Escherichia fergusonii]EGC08136.1 hypothetical protein ERIG_01277 [Escherichia fergusonii B253]